MSNININKPNEQLDKILAKAVPSQLPVNVMKTTYDRMMKHCMSDTTGGLWACRKNGARVMCKMVLQNIFDETTGQMTHSRVPIVYMYCSSCDKAPRFEKNSSVWHKDLISVTM